MFSLDYPHPPNQYLKRVIIASGGAESSAVDLIGAGGFRGLSVCLPTTWTAANIGFQTSLNGSDWLTLRKEDGALAVIENPPASSVCSAPADAWSIGQYPYLRLISIDSSGVSVPQTGERVLWVALLK